MKKTILMISTVAATLLITSCGPSAKDAMEYSNKIVSIGKEMDATSTMFINQIDGHNVDSLKLVYGKYDAQVTASMEECKNMQPFNKKRDFLDAAIEYFNSMKSLADNEAKGMVDIMSKDSAQITEQDVANVKAFAAKYDTDYKTALQKVQDAQTTFAKEWKFEIKEN